MVSDDLVRVARVVDLPVDSIHRYEVDGAARVLVRSSDGFAALDGVCTHEEAELSDGEVDGGVLWCPLHTSGFDLRTGRPVCPPAEVRLCRYDVFVEDGAVLVSRTPSVDAEET